MTIDVALGLNVEISMMLLCVLSRAYECHEARHAATISLGDNEGTPFPPVNGVLSSDLSQWWVTFALKR